MLYDVNNNCHHAQLIFTQLLDDIEKTWELEEFDLPAIATVIKERKIIQGLKFLPITIGNLTKSMHLLLMELAETRKFVSKHKIDALLEELNRQNGIFHGRTEIKRNNEIL